MARPAQTLPPDPNNRFDEGDPLLVDRTGLELAQLRNAVDRVVRSREVDASGFRLIGVGHHEGGSEGGSGFTVDVDLIRHDLTYGAERIVGLDAADTLQQLVAILRSHIARVTKAAEAASAGTIGWIDGAALGMLSLCDTSPEEAVEELKRQPRIRRTFADDLGRDCEAFLRWRDGTIVCACECIDGDWRFDEFRLVMRDPGLPQTVLSSLPGRRLRDVLEQPFMPDDATIVALPSIPAGWLAIDVAISATPIHGSAI